MGMNYYVKQAICPHCGRSDPPVHIGKLSFGWRFLFATAAGWPDSREGWRERLQGAAIVDEDGAPVSLEDLERDWEASKGGRMHTLGVDGFLDAEGWPFWRCEFE